MNVDQRRVELRLKENDGPNRLHMIFGDLKSVYENWLWWQRSTTIKEEKHVSCQADQTLAA